MPNHWEHFDIPTHLNYMILLLWKVWPAISRTFGAKSLQLTILRQGPYQHVGIFPSILRGLNLPSGFTLIPSSGYYRVTTLYSYRSVRGSLYRVTPKKWMSKKALFGSNLIEARVLKEALKCRERLLPARMLVFRKKYILSICLSLNTFPS